MVWFAISVLYVVSLSKLGHAQSLQDCGPRRRQARVVVYERPIIRSAQIGVQVQHGLVTTSRHAVKPLVAFRGEPSGHCILGTLSKDAEPHDVTWKREMSARPDTQLARARTTSTAHLTRTHIVALQAALSHPRLSLPPPGRCGYADRRRRTLQTASAPVTVFMVWGATLNRRSLAIRFLFDQ